MAGLWHAVQDLQRRVEALERPQAPQPAPPAERAPSVDKPAAAATVLQKRKRKSEK